MKLTRLFLVLMVLFTMIAFSSCKQKKNASKINETTIDSVVIDSIPIPIPIIQLLQDSVFMVVEEMPMFPGGDVALLKYISKHINYPEVAKENNIQGKVIVRFCVTAKGDVNQVSIFKGVSPELDAEALKVVKTLPDFKPGKQGGKPVPVWYMVPITFTLK
jgi:TonB family protein